MHRQARICAGQAACLAWVGGRGEDMGTEAGRPRMTLGLHSNVFTIALSKSVYVIVYKSNSITK
jgi:hypothetical protein